jgi:hypothetical protein
MERPILRRGLWRADDDDDEIHTIYALSPKEQQRHLRYSSETPTFYQNDSYEYKE